MRNADKRMAIKRGFKHEHEAVFVENSPESTPSFETAADANETERNGTISKQCATNRIALNVRSNNIIIAQRVYCVLCFSAGCSRQLNADTNRICGHEHSVARVREGQRKFCAAHNWTTSGITLKYVAETADLSASALLGSASTQTPTPPPKNDGRHDHYAAHRRTCTQK